MPSFSPVAKAALLAAVLSLTACVTGGGVTVADMYKANYGVHAFPHFDASADPDPAAITNGLYVPRSLRGVPSRSSWAP